MPRRYLICILFLMLFAACRKSDVSTQNEKRSYPPIDTAIIYASNQIEYHFLKWTDHQDQHLLTADLNVPKPYIIQKVGVVHAQGGLKSFDIPEYDGMFTPTLYFKTDSSKVTIYAFYSGNKPPGRSEFENEDEYLIGLYYFVLDNISIATVKIIFNPLINGDPPLDSTLLDELTYRIHWVPENPHLLSSTLRIPDGFSVSDSTVVTAIGVDTVIVPRFDNATVQKFYYIMGISQITLYLYSDNYVPTRGHYDNDIEYAIAYAEWAANYSPPYDTVKVKFK